jgi:hypothetical protein
MNRVWFIRDTNIGKILFFKIAIHGHGLYGRINLKSIYIHVEWYW